MKKGIIGLSLLLTLSLIPAYSATPPKAGSSCSKQGITKTYQGKKFTCIKSGKKLVWDKGTQVKKTAPDPKPLVSQSPTPNTNSPSPSASPTSSSTPTASPSPSPTPSSQGNSGSTSVIKQKRSQVTYASPSLTSEDVELCKIKQMSNDGTKSGFPAAAKLYQSTGVVKWALIPLDFSDLPGEPNFLARAQYEMDSASDWADISSEGQLRIEWKIYEKWIRLPGRSTDYAIPASDNQGFGSPAQQRVWTRAITEADKYFDFTGIQAVQFILPAGQKIIEYGIKGNGWFDVVKNFRTNEGTRIELFSIPSTIIEEPNSGRNLWSWWMYHYVVGLGVAKLGGSKVATPLMPYFIQGMTEGERDLGGWIRFLVGWMPEARIYCRNASSLTKLDITLIPLNDNGAQGIKLAIFPLSQTKALILESRRVSKFSCTTRTERSGVLAYIYDSTFGHMEEYFQPIASMDRAIESYSCLTGPTKDLLLHEGDKVTYEGITIEILGHGDFDQVRLIRNP